MLADICLANPNDGTGREDILVEDSGDLSEMNIRFAMVPCVDIATAVGH